VGSVDTWSIIDPGNKPIFAIAAGVGKHITFEQDLATRWPSRIVLLDPTPTGVETMEKVEAAEGLEYLPFGLSTKDGMERFAKPQRAEEGSFSIANDVDEDAVEFECRTLETLLLNYGCDAIDILKLDIEGFEYAVLDCMLAQRIPVGQICVEIHTRQNSGSPASPIDAAWLIFRLYWAGYRIVFNKSMDFTFCHVGLLKQANQKRG
jgi:FkbM family methyltransferase